jgi:hypothetical protein
VSAFFDEQLKSLLRRLKRRDGPPALYHYTSASGLLGILERRALWATSIWYLNDQREFAVALDLTEEVLKEREERTHARFERGVFEVLRQAVERAREASVFVASFSEHPDQLSQWRGYTPPHNGYAIGFATSMLRQLASGERPFVLLPCVYDIDDQRALVDRIIAAVSDHAKGMWTPDADNSQRVFREVYQEFASLLALISPVIKDDSFEEESEWRLVSLPHAIDRNDWRFRPGRSSIVPYYQVDLAFKNTAFELESVVVGPTPNVDLAVSALEAMLGAKGIKIGQVQPSQIPYRDW